MPSKLQRMKSNKDSDSSSDSDESTIYETESESEVEIKNSSKKHFSKKHSNKKGKRKTKGKKKEDEEDEEESEDEDEDEEEDSEFDSEDDYSEFDSEDEDEECSDKEYKKFLSKIFPSKYSKKRANDDSDSESDSESDSDSDSESDSESESQGKKPKNKKNDKKSKDKKNKKKDKKKDKKSKKKDKKKSKKSKKSKKKDKKSESSSEEDTSSSSSTETSEKEDKEINIILSIGDEDDNFFGAYHDEEEEMNEDENEECDTDDEQAFMKETYEKVEAPVDLNKPKKNKNKKTKDKKDIKQDKGSLDIDAIPYIMDKSVENKYKEMLELKKDLSKKYIENPNKILKRAIKDCRKSIHNLIRDSRKKNVKEFRELIRNDAKKPNEMNYFSKKLSNTEQMQVMKDLREINKHINIDKPYRLALLQTKIPAKYKAFAMEKLNMLKSMDPGDNEYYKIKTWVDTFMRIPFSMNKDLPVKMSDGLDPCHTFMKNAKKTLDECVFGLDDAKLQIMQMIGQWITNPDAMGTAIAIKGPPGTGKTTLVKEGISKILCREFAFIPLGGTGDAAYLEGHSYTYEGSKWGKIVQLLIDAKCTNPVIYFDELDKISDTPKGEEITGILTHLTDTTQNNQFNDKYFSEIDFDLSKCLFIFSYNDESRVNPILKDRMYRIETKGYDAKEKLIIARQYMLPKIREQVNFKEDEVIIPDETILYIVNTKHLTNGEAGVRNMKRCLEIIHTKLNLFRLIKPEDNMFKNDISFQVNFPITVTREYVDLLIKNEEKQSQSLLMMYC